MSSQDGVSSLILASHNGHVEVVDKLVQQGARVDLQTKVFAVHTKIYMFKDLMECQASIVL